MEDSTAALSAFDALVKATQHSSWRVRHEACFALGKLKKSQALPSLVKSLKDTVELVRKSSAFAIGEILKHQSTLTVVEPLQPEQTSLTFNDSLSVETAFNALLNSLSDNYYSVRYTAQDAITKALQEQAAVRIMPASQ